jgi:hypothetical protein
MPTNFYEGVILVEMFPLKPVFSNYIQEPSIHYKKTMQINDTTQMSSFTTVYRFPFHFPLQYYTFYKWKKLSSYIHVI